VKLSNLTFAVLLVASPVFAKKEPKPPAVASEYDKFTDRGTLSVTAPVISPPASGFSRALGVAPTGEVTMSVALVFTGQPGKSPAVAAFAVLSAITVNRLGYIDDHRFGCIVDGVRHNFDGTHRYRRIGSGPQFVETADFDVPFALVRSLGSAKAAECRFGSSEFVLAPEVLSAFKELAKNLPAVPALDPNPGSTPAPTPARPAESP